jgi:hypothetical protein
VDVRLPDGTVIANVPDGTTKAQLIAKLEANGYDVSKLTPQTQAPAEPKEYAGFGGAYADAVKTLTYSDEALAWQNNPTKENRDKLLTAAKSTYKTVGFGEGHNFEAFLEALGGSLGSITAPAAAATVGSFVSTPIGGVAAGLATNTAQYTTQNLLRQAQQQEQNEQEGVSTAAPSLGKAVAAGTAQATLDLAGEKILSPLFSAFPIVRNLVASGGGKEGAAATEALADSVSKGTLKPYKDGIWRGVGKGVAVEVPQEIAQQALERWSAGLPLTGPEAKEEYKQAAIGAVALGGPMGVGAHVISRYKERNPTTEPTTEPIEPSVEADEEVGAPTEKPASTYDAAAYNTKVSQLIKAGVPEHEALQRAGEQLHEEQDQAQREDNGRPQDVPVNDEGAGDSTVVPSAEGSGAGPTTETTEPAGGGVATPRGAARSTRRSATRRNAALAAEAQPEAPPEATKPKTPVDTAIEQVAQGAPKEEVAAELQKAYPDVAPEVVAHNVDTIVEQVKVEPVETPVEEVAPEKAETPEAPVDMDEVNAPAVREQIAREAKERKQQARATTLRAPLEQASKKAREAAPTRSERAVDAVKRGSLGEALYHLMNEAGHDTSGGQTPYAHTEASPLRWLSRQMLNLVHRGDIKEREAIIKAEVARRAQDRRVRGDTSITAKEVRDIRNRIMNDYSLTKVDAFDANGNLTAAGKILYKGSEYGRPIRDAEGKLVRNFAPDTRRLVEFPKSAKFNTSSGEFESLGGGETRTVRTTGERRLGLEAQVGEDGKKKLVPVTAKLTSETAETTPIVTPDKIKKGAFAGARVVVEKSGLRGEAKAAVERLKMEGKDAEYDPKSNTFYFTEAGLNDRTILHEMVHAVTTKVLKAYENPETRAQLTEAQQKGAAELHKIYEVAKKELGEDFKDGLENVYEFASHAATDGRFQKALSDIPAGKLGGIKRTAHPSMWDMFTRALAKMLGLDRQQGATSGNALLNASMALKEIMSVPEKGTDVQPLASKAQPKIREALKEVEEIQSRIDKSKRGDEFNRSVGELFAKTRSVSELLKVLRASWDTMDVSKIRAVLPALTTRDITRWVGDKVGSVKEISKAVRSFEAMKSHLNRELVDKVPEWVTFNAKFKEGGALLEELMATTTLSGVDITAHADLADALKNDPDILTLQASKDTKGLQEREKAIRHVYALRDKLSKYDKGRGLRIYKMALDTYRERSKNTLQLILETLDKSGLSPEAKASTRRGIESRFMDDRKVRVYFPLMRYGNYWFTTGKGPKSERYQFHSETARNRFAADHAERLRAKGDTRSVKELIADGEINMGDQPDSRPWERIGESDKMLHNILEVVDSSGLSDVDAFKDQLYQLYLTSLPSADPRKRLLPREGKAGFAMDQLRNFVVSGQQYASSSARLKHGADIRNAVGAAYAELQGNPDKVKLRVFVDEFAKRAGLELTPPRNDGLVDWDKLAALGNKATFYWMLSAPKQAITQLTQLHTTGLPVLASKYGWGDTNRIALKYMNPLNRTLGMAKHTVDHKTGEVTATWEAPSIALSKYVLENKNPELRKVLMDGIKHAEENNVFADTRVAELTSRGKAPSTSHGGVVPRSTRIVGNFLSGAFHHSERLSREIMFMSALELEYTKARKEGLNPQAAKDRAVNAAEDAVYEALYDYSSYNKPSMMKAGAVTKLATQYQSFPIQTISYLSRNFFTMLKKEKSPEERKAAATKFIGTMLMTGLYGGVTNMFGYSMIMGAVQAVRDALSDEDNLDKDTDDEGNPMGKMSLDLWFRKSFVPEFFGRSNALGETLSGGVANSFLYGPISVMSDMNIGTSVGMDDMFFHSDSSDQEGKEAWEHFVYTNAFGAFGALTSQAADAYTSFKEGDLQRGFEKISPAMFRGLVKAMRLGTEGRMTTRGRQIDGFDKDFYTTGKLIAQGVGFGSTQSDIADKEFNIIYKLSQKINESSKEALDSYTSALLKYHQYPTTANEKAVDKAMDKMREHNRKYPMHGITSENIDQSINSITSSQENVVHGAVMPTATAPYIRELNQRQK